MNLHQTASTSNGEQQPVDKPSRIKQPHGAHGPRQRTWAKLAWTWSALIVLICLLPYNPSGPPSALPLDKLAHFLLFAAFGALWLKACPRRLVMIAIAGTVFGLAIEILQSVLGWGRMGEGADLAADCMGLFFALGVGARWGHARRLGQG